MLRTFGRRKGRGISSRDVEKLHEGIPGITFSISGNDKLNVPRLFPTSINEYWLEIGSGNGEHAVHQAANNPGIGIIACEPYYNGIAVTAKKISRLGLDNLRLYPGDGRELLVIKEESGDLLQHPSFFSRCFVLFPDPWPKKRHHKRRLLSKEMLALLAASLAPGGLLRIATDSVDYAEHIMLAALQNKNLKWTAGTADDFRLPPPDFTTTPYYRKAIAEGRKPVFLEFQIAE